MLKIKWNAYWRLARLDKPIGIFLLWYPTTWALWLANHGKPPFILVLLFALGTIFMRSAGCIVNDMADRHIDKFIKRTKLRPLATQEISFFEASIILFIFLFASLVILLFLPRSCVFYALIALVITAIYPFCKRFLATPQLVLGLAFSMGIPMAYQASHVAFDRSCLLIWIINFAWIIAYDTEYALSDRDDDLLIGVKSTAIFFGKNTQMIIALLQIFFHGLWLAAVQLSPYFIIFWLIGGCLLMYQQLLLQKNNRPFQAFLNNNWYGLCLWVSLMVY